MQKRTDPLVEWMFEDIAYSTEVSEAQEKIRSALDEKYHELCKNASEGEATDMLLEEYGQLVKMAQLAGYTEEQVLAWRNVGDAQELRLTKKLMWRQRLRTYAAFMYLRALADKYTKRLFNSIALLTGALFVFVGSELSFYVFGNSKSAELTENFLSNMAMVEIPLFLYESAQGLLCRNRAYTSGSGNRHRGSLFSAGNHVDVAE